MEVSMMRHTWAALCIAVFVMSGSTEGASLVTLKAMAASPSVTYDFIIDITNRIYNDSLLNPQSQDYNVLYDEVSSALYSVYGCPACDTGAFYQGVTAMTFSEMAGSVVVQATTLFDSDQTNDVVITFMFLQAINGSNEINGLSIDPEFTLVVPGSALISLSVPSPTTTATTMLATPPTITTTTTPTTISTTTPTTTPTTTKSISPV